MYEYANFARPQGAKDKKPRKRRAAAIAGGVLGGGALLGAGARYGGAALATRNAQSRLYNGPSAQNRRSNRVDRWKDMKMPINTARDAQSGGARGQLGRDVESLKGIGRRVRDYDYKGAPGRAWELTKAAPGRVGQSFKNAYSAATTGQGIGGMKGALARGKAVLGTGAGRAGAIGAGGLALGGAGLGIYKAIQNRRKNRK